MFFKATLLSALAALATVVSAQSVTLGTGRTYTNSHGVSYVIYNTGTYTGSLFKHMTPMFTTVTLGSEMPSATMAPASSMTSMSVLPVSPTMSAAPSYPYPSASAPARATGTGAYYPSSSGLAVATGEAPSNKNAAVAGVAILAGAAAALMI